LPTPRGARGENLGLGAESPGRSNRALAAAWVRAGAAGGGRPRAVRGRPGARLRSSQPKDVIARRIFRSSDGLTTTTSRSTTCLKCAICFFEVKNVLDKTYIASANNITDNSNAATGLQNPGSIRDGIDLCQRSALYGRDEAGVAVISREVSRL
jgi:hypothetical protein